MNTKHLVPLDLNHGIHVSQAGHTSLCFQMGILKYPVLRVEEITEVIPVRKGWKRRMLEVTSQLLHISAKQKLCFIIFVAQAFPLEVVLVRILCVCV